MVLLIKSQPTTTAVSPNKLSVRFQSKLNHYTGINQFVIYVAGSVSVKLAPSPSYWVNNMLNLTLNLEGVDYHFSCGNLFS